jgi:ketosteroid isomerase-like protein
MHVLACALRLAAATAVDGRVDPDVAAIEALTREFVAGFNSGDVEPALRFYADSYVDMNLREPVQTRDQRREYLRKIVEPRNVRIEVVPAEIVVSGDHAFVRGTIRLHRLPGAGHAEETVELRYMELARKFPDGWKAIWGIDAEIYANGK